MTDSGQNRFLRNAGWGDAARTPLQGDLSSRAYTRLARIDGGSAILMEDPDTVSLGAFAGMTDWLRAGGLSAPRILFGDPSDGRLLVEDFGDLKATALIAEDPSRQGGLYDLAIDALLAIRARPAPTLDRPDARALVEATRLADAYYPGADRVALDGIRDVLGTALEDILAGPATVSLRDFHTDNIMWLPERQGIAQLGLLDYQDAFLIHPAYDLMSLLTDARTEVPADVAEEMLKTYADKSGDIVQDLERAVAVLGTQRNLRILGIFCRSAARDGKHHHLSALPRVRTHLAACLGHRVFAGVADHFDRAVPPGAEARI